MESINYEALLLCCCKPWNIANYSLMNLDFVTSWIILIESYGSGLYSLFWNVEKKQLKMVQFGFLSPNYPIVLNDVFLHRQYFQVGCHYASTESHQKKNDAAVVAENYSQTSKFTAVYYAERPDSLIRLYAIAVLYSCSIPYGLYVFPSLFLVISSLLGPLSGFRNNETGITEINEREISQWIAKGYRIPSSDSGIPVPFKKLEQLEIVLFSWIFELINDTSPHICWRNHPTSQVNRKLIKFLNSRFDTKSRHIQILFYKVNNRGGRKNVLITLGNSSGDFSLLRYDADSCLAPGKNE